MDRHCYYIRSKQCTFFDYKRYFVATLKIMYTCKKKIKKIKYNISILMVRNLHAAILYFYFVNVKKYIYITTK